MARERNGTLLQDFGTLFHVGVAAGLTDGQLLERFTTRGGEAAELAFAALVERHSPMVLRACRGILRDDHEAQDAFQATFLILVRSGRTLWVRDSLGPWLHRVACRVAVRAKLAADRRQAAERRAAELAERPMGEVGRHDLGGMLHEEIDRLPDHYRIPVVLCDLEGRTYDDAARHLGCPVGTVKSRLARGRERLRGRLCRRGIAPSAAVLRTVLSVEMASAAVPRMLLRAEAAGTVSATALSLANGLLRSMLLTKLKWAAAIVVAVAIVGSAAGQVAGWASDASPILDGPIRGGERRPESPQSKDLGTPNGPPVGRSVTEERIVPPFEEVHVAGDLKVVITPGPEHRVMATGRQKRLGALRTRVEKTPNHARLRLDVLGAGRAGGDRNPGDDSDRIEVRITLPRLFGVVAEGHATVEIRELKDEALALTVLDTAKVNVSGTSDRLNATIGDAGELDASRLEVETASVTAAGRSSSVFHARKSLSVIPRGDARVEYLGAPQIYELASGGARVVRRRSTPAQGPSRP